MADWLHRLVARWLRVPAEPDPPAGDLSSLRVFRAAPAYFRYRLLGWAVGQVGTLVGLLVGLALGLSFIVDWKGSGIVHTALAVLAVLAWVGFLLQIPLSLAALRLDYDMRWYMLSDRALRIREGILRVREKTMTFANIQQISVRQGPLQRLLGIADVEVRTAGGGSSDEAGEGMHTGYFRGVADAEAIRDTIRERVREYRGAGLGDEALPGPPGGHHPSPRGPSAGGTAASGPSPGGPTGARTASSGRPARSRQPVSGAVLEAARSVLEEARALRTAAIGDA